MCIEQSERWTCSISFLFRSWKVKSEKHFTQIDSQIHSWHLTNWKVTLSKEDCRKLFLHNQGQCTKSEMKSSLKRQNQRWKYYNLICFCKIPFILRFAHGGGFFLTVTGKGKVLEWPGVELWPGVEQDFEVNWPQLTRHSPHSWGNFLFGFLFGAAQQRDLRGSVLVKGMLFHLVSHISD